VRVGSVARRAVPALALAVLAAAPAVAVEPDTPMRPCRRTDLPGIWRVLRLGVPSGVEVDRADPAFQPHQRYVFHADATMVYVASTLPFSPEEQRALARTPGTARWTVEPGGRLVQQESEGASSSRTSECQVVLEPVRDPRTSQPTAQIGDVLLTDPHGDAHPSIRRLLRRIGSAN
jgi:hypothetical protein